MARRKTGRTPKEPSHTVSFRVDARTFKRLDAAAEELAMSPGAYARKLLVDGLEDHVRAQLLEEVAQTHQAVTGLRNDIASALEMVLLNLTDAGKDDVQAWISKNLRR